MTAWRSKHAGLILAAGMLLQASGCCCVAPKSQRQRTDNQENELKLIIDRDGYDRLRDWFEREGGATGEVLSASQSNYYFDFLDEENGRLLLKRKGVNCRLRTKEQAAIFTVKVGEPIDVEALTLLELKTLLELAALDSLAKKPEYQCSLAGGVETARSILAGTLQFLSDDVNYEECTDPSPSSILTRVLDSGLVTTGGG